MWCGVFVVWCVCGVVSSGSLRGGEGRDVVWCGVMWCGVLWFIVVCYGVVRAFCRTGCGRVGRHPRETVGAGG